MGWPNEVLPPYIINNGDLLQSMVEIKFWGTLFTISNIFTQEPPGTWEELDDPKPLEPSRKI